MRSGAWGRHLHSRPLGVAAVLSMATVVGYAWLLRQQGTFELGGSGRALMVPTGHVQVPTHHPPQVAER